MEKTGASSSEFKERVNKTFGKLLTPETQTWSLSGTQIEKRIWRRDVDTSDRDNIPCASSFINSDGDLDLRASIGLDSTLDNEDEEDAYDKVALGRENASDRWYMGAVANKNVPSSVSTDDLSPGSGVRQRDPRANHLAAKIRLKEDDAEVGAGAGQHKTTQDPPSVEKEHISLARDVAFVKPILKRKEQHNSTSKSTKRVKFDPEFVKEGNTGSEIPSDDITSVNQSVLDERVSRVPDYVRNPSKYTCYSLDSSDEMNDELMGKNSPTSGSLSEENGDLTDLPKSIPFVPKKKPDCGKADDVTCESANTGDGDLKNSSAKSTVVTGFIDGNILEPEVDDMEVDEREKSEVPSSKKDRQYRAKPQTDEPE